MMSRPEVGFVYFDLDDTIVDHHAAQSGALDDLCSVGGALEAWDAARVRSRYHTINVDLWRRYGRGEIDRRTVEEQRFARLLRDLRDGTDGPPREARSDARSAAVAAGYLERYVAHWSLIPGARAAFEAVAERYPVGIITNGFAEIQRRKLDRFPFLVDRARAVVISEEVGVMKPHLDLFRHAEEAAGVRGGSVMYVGDSWESDVLGAARAGWQAIWIHPAAEARPPATLAVRSWDDFAV